MHRILRFGLLIGLVTVPGFAQTLPGGPQVLTFLSAVDDSDQPYALYLPKNYEASKKWPLVVSLHGAGSNHRLNLRRVFGLGNRPGETDAQATRVFPPFGDVEFIIASPLARGTMGYQGIAEKDVLDVLADVKKRFAIDEDRVYLTGLSMGGGGTLWLGLTRPDLWAAIAPVCPAAPPGIGDLASNALHLPVKLFQGDSDPVVPAAGTRAWNQRFLDAGVRSEYVEYKGVRHNSWDNAYKDRAIFDWFRQFRRVQHPARVSYRTSTYAHAGAYWLQFDRFTSGTLASADAEFAKGTLRVTTSNLDAFTVRASDLPGVPTSVQIDGAALKVRPGKLLSFHKAGSKWVAGLLKPAPGEKQPGAEGPIADAVAGAQVYVYGTEGSPTPAELLVRRETAGKAAAWSTSRNPLLLNFRVLADKQATEAEVAGATTVLIGTRETNSTIAAVAGQLPMHLNPSAADYGMMYVYPVNGHYVLIQSGLPWWTRLDQASRPGLSFNAPAWRNLLSFGDYVVFRGGIDNIVAEGKFDNGWQLPAGAAEALRTTGAVEIGSK